MSQPHLAARGYRRYEGEFITIDWHPQFIGTLYITRKSSGQEYAFLARDIKAWVIEILRGQIDRKVERIGKRMLEEIEIEFLEGR